MAKRRKTSRRKHRRVSGDPSLAPAVVSGTRMGKHKRHGKRRGKRRSKMGAITGSDAGDMLLGLGLGVGAAIAADAAGSKFLEGKEKVVSAIKILIGGAAAIKSKNPIIRGAGMGLAAQGVYTGAKEFGIIKGMEEFIHGVGAGKDEMLIEMNGVNDGVELNSARIMQGTSLQQPPAITGDDAMYGMPSVVG